MVSELDELRAQVVRLQRRLERERAALAQAETIAERGLRESYERQRELALLSAVTDQANRGTDFHAALRMALPEVARHGGWDVAHAWLPDGAGGWVSANIWHVGGSGREAMTEALVALRDGGSMPARVAAGLRPIGIPDLGVMADCSRAGPAARAGLRSALGVPVCVGDVVGAVLEFFSVATRACDDRELQLMGQVGLQLGRILERQQAEERRAHQALHDDLTGLPNRRLFIERLTAAIRRQQRHTDYGFAVVVLAMDRLHAIAEGMGHAAIDAVLVEAGRRLEQALRTGELAHTIVGAPRPPGNDTVARLAVHDFALLLEDLGAAEHAVAIAERAAAALQQPFQVGAHEVIAPPIVGLAHGSAAATDAALLLRNATLALQAARDRPERPLVVYEDRMHVSALGRVQLETELRRALDREEFRVYYQPLVDLRSGRLSGVEALVRWAHPTRGMVSPAEFIPVAEAAGMIRELGTWVARMSCATARGWRDRFAVARDMVVNVNVSPQQFGDPGLVELLQGLLAETRLEPAGLKLELTESLAMRDPGRAEEVFRAIRGLGLAIAIDDFGTGYSSLGRLRRFPVQTLKVDRSFVVHMEDDPGSRAIVTGLVALATALGMDVVAEGVETPTQVALLRAAGCAYGQGYFFSKPLSVEDMTLMLEQEEADAVANASIAAAL